MADRACATPVIAYSTGGAVEIVRGLEEENPTGVLSQQTVDCLVQAIERFESENYRISAENCRENA